MTWGAALLVAACIAMLAATQLYFAYDVDKDARRQSEMIVDMAIGNHANTLQNELLPQTYWDDAVLNLDNRFDPNWARMMIGDYFVGARDYDLAAVFDRDDRLTMLRQKAVGPDATVRRQIVTSAKSSIATVRALERKRGPLPAVQPDGMSMKRISAWDLATINGSPFLLAAGLVQPDQRAHPLARRSAVALIGKKLDQTTIDALASEHHITDMRFLAPGAKVDPGMGVIALVARDGTQIGQLTWKPRDPGSALVHRAAPYLLIFSLLVAGAVIAMTMRTRRLTQSLMVSEARASHMAFHDVLTGLPNRARLESAYAEISARSLARGASFAMLCIDLDHFKAVNDSLGHLAGDSLIRVIAGRIRNACNSDEFVARFGGDEFVILKNATDARGAAALAERLIASIAEPVELEAGRVFVGASIGIVTSSWENISANECLRRADLALYDAKDAGRNCYRHFSPTMDRQVRRRQQMRTQLHDALRDGDIHLHYQPQVDVSGRIVGVEALSRWDIEGMGSIAPGDFVPIAEESGLIDSLGLFIFRQAFQDSQRWPHLTVAINVSAMQLRSGDFVDSLRELVKRFDVDPRQFELEITERLLMADDRHSLAILRQLRRMGFSIVLDDFGTGYSSLGYLQRFPIDKVKIDRSFVARIDVDRQAESVVLAIIQLAHALGLKVVAEGVETDAQRQSLRAAGCNDVQGYLTGRPMPAEAITNLVEEGVRPLSA
ncbi:putative bifunctional diguanylate cyclase/phosphodiesterase [Sphingomonas jaspsi]|uniref:putative bifunctional diguanylate cyclase/phosphodiesterase n=1 Tax=Sphingomonas jaspsi TaxID=392409 RepID=UPI0005665D66|nr:bifunctional diguanylate cyclase/phosphodiesterase [Sphingomonas jaspsi]